VADEKKTEEKKEEKADDAKKVAPAKEEKKEDKGGKGKDAKEAKEEGKEGEAPAEGAEGEAQAKKKIPKKVLIIAGAGVGAVLLIGIIVAVLFMTGVLGGKPDAGVHAADAAAKDVMSGAAPKDDHGDGKEKKKEGGAVFYDLGEMIVNLNTDGKRQTFLKLVVQLELESVEDKLVIDTMRPRIIDNFQTYLRELRVDDLRGSAGLYRLREELLFRVTEAVHPIKIRDVLFQQMLVQ
jgi:flagellar protein FliL